MLMLCLCSACVTCVHACALVRTNLKVTYDKRLEIEVKENRSVNNEKGLTLRYKFIEQLLLEKVTFLWI